MAHVMVRHIPSTPPSAGFPRGRGVRPRPDRRGAGPDVGRDAVRGVEGQGRQERQGGDSRRRGGQLERSRRLHPGRLKHRVSARERPLVSILFMCVSPEYFRSQHVCMYVYL